jgi:hypothetical protein
MPTLDDLEHAVVRSEVERAPELDGRRSYHDPLPKFLPGPPDEEKTRSRAGRGKIEINHPGMSRKTRVDLTVFRPAPSLAPDESIMLGCVLGDEESCAIRDAWRPTLKIVSWSAARYDCETSADLMVYVSPLAGLARNK